MENKNKLNEFEIADLDKNELTKIERFEQELDNKYYIIAFQR